MQRAQEAQIVGERAVHAGVDGALVHLLEVPHRHLPLLVAAHHDVVLALQQPQ